MRRLSPITSIEELLKHDAPYLPIAPVILFDRPRRRRFASAILKALATLFAVFVFSGSGGMTRDYVSALCSFEGSSYSKANCSLLITKAKRHAPCSARQMWDGCGGDLAAIQEVTSFAEVSKAKLVAGDVVDFGGVHVAAYIGGGSFIDSIPERGVAKFQTVNLRDPWYAGKVRILRWRQS